MHSKNVHHATVLRDRVWTIRGRSVIAFARGGKGTKAPSRGRRNSPEKRRPGRARCVGGGVHYNPAMESDYALQYENLWRRHWWWQSRKRFVLQKLRRLARRGSLDPVLDIGCGNGLFFEELAQFGEVRGIESDPLLVREGPQRGRIDVRMFDASFVPTVPPRLVLMLDVLEHIEDDLAAARHVRKILAPGGVFLLTVPALMGLWSQHDVANRHYRRYTRGSLRKVLVEAGFVVESLHYFFGWTVVPMVLRRMLAPGVKPGGGEAAGKAQYHVHVPAGPVNGAMYGLSRLEQVVLGGCVPVGSSVMAIARPG